MECKKCKAYGIDDIGFYGCLVRHTMEDLPNEKVGCRRQKKTILREIEETKEGPKSKYYKWVNEAVQQ